MSATTQTPGRGAPGSRRAPASRARGRLGERVLEQARGRQGSAIELVRKLMAGSGR